MKENSLTVASVQHNLQDDVSDEMSMRTEVTTPQDNRPDMIAEEPSSSTPRINNTIRVLCESCGKGHKEQHSCFKVEKRMTCLNCQSPMNLRLSHESSRGGVMTSIAPDVSEESYNALVDILEKRLRQRYFNRKQQNRYNGNTPSRSYSPSPRQIQSEVTPQAENTTPQVASQNPQLVNTNPNSRVPQFFS